MMDERRRELDRVRAEIERALADGITLDPAEWTRRNPDLQPELGELLAELIGQPATLGSPAPAPGQAPTIAGFDASETTALAEASPSSSPTLAAGADLGSTVAFGATVSGSEPTVPGATITLGGSGAPASGEVTAAFAPGISSAAPTIAGWSGAVIDPSAETGAFNTNAPRARLPETVNDPDRGRGTEALPSGRRVRYIGDYELISVLGRGGMGVVYRARQISLNRQVALKMIANAEFAGEEQVRRFQNEAEAVALLDHPGIVPIYEVGTFEDQRYFSMKLVDGQGMEKALPALRANAREAARIVAEVADAVYHAHQRGILHRDLKPANILLDHERHPHVSDFGLAKRIEGEDGLTVTGAVMGTPAYMSPEQAAGQTTAITTASDVYGLGAIFFAALTDRAPFVGNSLMLTLDRVRNNPPDAPRRLNPGVPVDLEVICLKCLEKEPRHRYASAKDLADDLRRWMAGEPISARPVGQAVRLAMWARRKPALAGLSVALVVASIVGIAGIAWQWREAVHHRDLAQSAEKAAVAQEKLARQAETKAGTARDAAVASEKAAVAARAEAEKNAQLASMQAALALGTTQEMLTRINLGLEGYPNLFDLKSDIFAGAIKSLSQVSSIYQGVTNKEATTLAGMIYLGQIYRQTGQIQQAVTIFQKCLEIAKERMIIKNRNSSARHNLARVYRELAVCAEELNRDMNAVIANLQEALKLNEDILARPTDEDPRLNPPAIRATLADIHTQLGAAYHHLGEIDKALEEFRQAFNLRTELLAGSKENPAQLRRSAQTAVGIVEVRGPILSRLLSSIALSALAMADCSDRLGRREVAEDYFRQALDLYEQAAKANPNPTESMNDMGNYHAAIGNYRFRHGELEAARRHYETSREQFASLAKADLRNAYVRRELFTATSRLAQLADVEKKIDLARKQYDEAARLAEEIYRVDEKNDLRRIEMMLLLPHVGQADRAIEIADRLSAGPKVDPELWTYLAQVYAQSARALPPEKTEQVQSLLVKSVEAIRKAIRAGFRDRAVLDNQHDLDPLRDREDFQLLLREVPHPG